MSNFSKNWKMAQNNTCALDTRKRDELVRTVSFLSDFAQSKPFNVAVRLEIINRIFGNTVLIFKCVARNEASSCPGCFISSSTPTVTVDIDPLINRYWSVEISVVTSIFPRQTLAFCKLSLYLFFVWLLMWKMFINNRKSQNPRSL